MGPWSEFEEAAPELAQRVRERVESFGWMLAGTIRRDGAPRISPVETHFVGGHLVLVMIRGTLKVRDLQRDARIVLNAPILDAADPGLECKLRGRAVEVGDAEFRRQAADAVERRSGWRPAGDWHVFSIDVDDVALIEWTKGAMELLHWRRGRGLERTARAAPELAS